MYNFTASDNHIRFYFEIFVISFYQGRWKDLLKKSSWNFIVIFKMYLHISICHEI